MLWRLDEGQYTNPLLLFIKTRRGAEARYQKKPAIDGLKDLKLHQGNFLLLDYSTLFAIKCYL